MTSQWEQQMLAYQGQWFGVGDNLQGHIDISTEVAPPSVVVPPTDPAPIEPAPLLELPAVLELHPSLPTEIQEWTPIGRRARVSYSAIEQWFANDDKKVKERAVLNYMSLTIYADLMSAIREHRGLNCQLAWSTIIKERLIAKDVSDAKSNTTGEVFYRRKVGGSHERMRLGRFLRRQVLPETVLSEVVFQAVIEQLTTFFFPTCTFVIDKGEKISENYRRCVGGGSCMAGESNYEKVAMYAENPNAFSMLVGRMNRNSARAILFHTDSGHTYLGNIYGGTSYLNQQMMKYATEKGWLLYDGGLRMEGELVHLSDDDCQVDMVISGVEWHEGGVPYMDDFIDATVQNDGTLTLWFDKGGDYCLQDTGGFLIDGCYCVCCEHGFSTEQCIGTDDGWYCEECYGEDFTVCADCDESVLNRRMTAVANGDEVCTSCRDDNYCGCTHCDGLIPNDEVTAVNDDDGNVCSDCLDASYVKCEVCDKYFSDTFTNEDGDELCECCTEEQSSEMDEAEVCNVESK
jgi:hypothetical protein